MQIRTDVPIDILPSNPTLDDLRRSVRFLEEKYRQQIVVGRKDGRKGSPLKHDYVQFLTNFVPIWTPFFYFYPANFKRVYVKYGSSATAIIPPPKHVNSDYPFVLVSHRPIPNLPSDILLEIFLVDVSLRLRVLLRDLHAKMSQNAFFWRVCKKNDIRISRVDWLIVFSVIECKHQSHKHRNLVVRR